MANALAAALRLRASTAGGSQRSKHGKQQSDTEQGRAQAVKAGGDGGQPLASSGWGEELQTSKYTVSRMDRHFERPYMTDYARDISSDKVYVNCILRRSGGKQRNERPSPFHSAGGATGARRSARNWSKTLKCHVPYFSFHGGRVRRAMSRDDLLSMLPGWYITHEEPFDASGLPRPLRNVEPRLYRLERK